MKFDTSNMNEPLATALARQMLQHGNDTLDHIVFRYRDAYGRLWHREDFGIADAQAVLDAMGDQAIPALQGNRALGELIETVAPGTLDPAELETPVPYTVDGTRVVLDPDATYPGPQTEEETA